MAIFHATVEEVSNSKKKRLFEINLDIKSILCYATDVY